MIIRLSKNVLDLLKTKGYTSYKLRKDKIFGEATIQDFRHNKIKSIEQLAKLCELLNCQPGEIIEAVDPDNDVQMSLF